MKTYQVEIVEKIVFQVSVEAANETEAENMACLLYTSPSEKTGKLH